jgi:hypothetical protein
LYAAKRAANIGYLASLRLEPNFWSSVDVGIGALDGWSGVVVEEAIRDG